MGERAGVLAVVSAIGTLVGMAAAVLVVVILRRRFVVVRVLGVSMQPVLTDGQRVLVRRAGLAAVRHGDLVVFPLSSIRARCEGDPPWMVKRAIALPGDPIPGGSVPHAIYINRDEVPQGKLIVRGDNTEWSYDSSQAGFVDGSALLGVVVRTLG